MVRFVVSVGIVFVGSVNVWSWGFLGRCVRSVLFVWMCVVLREIVLSVCCFILGNLIIRFVIVCVGMR